MSSPIPTSRDRLRDALKGACSSALRLAMPAHWYGDIAALRCHKALSVVTRRLMSITPTPIMSLASTGQARLLAQWPSWVLYLLLSAGPLVWVPWRKLSNVYSGGKP
jgi:hypothetical protein